MAENRSAGFFKGEPCVESLIMIIRSSALTTTRRTLPVGAPVAQRAAQSSSIDSFEPAAPVRQTAIQQSAANGVQSSSSGGGFFSQLWGRVKNVLSGLLG